MLINFLTDITITDQMKFNEQFLWIINRPIILFNAKL